MRGLLRKIFIRIRMAFFPNEAEKEVKRWVTDGGDEKLRCEYDLDDSSLVMDLGGYKGQWASDIYARYNCRVLVFEPVKGFAARITERFKKNKNIEVFCLALGKSRRLEPISLCEDGSSVLRKSREQEMVQFEDVQAFFKEKNIQQVDLMKINVEGGEYEVLPRMLETGLIHKIKYLQVQFHAVGPNAEIQMENIRTELAKTHKSRYQYKFVWESWDRY